MGKTKKETRKKIKNKPEDKIIKNVRNLFRIKKDQIKEQIENNIKQDVRNIFT